MNNSELDRIVCLESADVARAGIHRRGAHLVSWQPAGDGQRLFLSECSGFPPSAAIRGGVPVIFPQFSVLGKLPKHGFARICEWSLASIERSADGAASASFRLTDSAATQAIWPHTFLAELRVIVVGSMLEISLGITNTGAAPFSFTAALHTYLRVADIAQTQVQGLRGIRYLDSAAGFIEQRDDGPILSIEGEVDRIYLEAPSSVTVQEAARVLEVRKQGFTDTVVWNPGAQKATTLADLEAEGWRRFLCVEAAVAGSPVELQAGESWAGRQTLIAG